MIAILLSSTLSFAAGQCATPEATSAYRRGFEAQKAAQSDVALEHYQACLDKDPACVVCQYEIGWTFWSMSDTDRTVAAWERTLELDPDHGPAQSWLPQAKNRTAGDALLSTSGVRVPIGITSGDGAVTLTLEARFQNYNVNPSHPDDHFDTAIYSPKSARFLSDGSKVYVNSLEGYRTAIYDPETRAQLGVIEHRFDKDDGDLFVGGESSVFGYPFARHGPNGNDNHFKGKPVEMTLTHDDKWLWVPYYRRDWDYGARSPSALAIVDTSTDDIVRVMPTGPVPKYVAGSPDGKWLAVTHWGDNTLGIIDVSAADPKAFRYLPERLVVENRPLNMFELEGIDRDVNCGMCLRGTAFTPDSKTLLVARMGDGGIAGFDTETWTYLGTVTGEKPTPRHLVISDDGETLYVSSNKTGHVSKIPLDTVVEALRSADGKRVPVEGYEARYVGGSARTIELSPDGELIHVAVNSASKLVTLDAETLEILAELRTDRYTVGLDVSPDGTQVWTTSQGKDRRGGNSVCVFSVQIKDR